ncbi:uncharacterized protein EI90DRAFT_3131496 [Cantharellus anzutake]|uniref:uncharacterized protein n=1 Tax=Cantharellus anzutake TaxID=1750568 RepID=UPI00190646F0|nr:uncharacterized protein EI90DRAFT_3131496 [Cantharellus anzutake]KAF8321859.1 hypothetical protein EI90DRAFT_3131496 [Cantharellus anzutake]
MGQLGPIFITYSPPPSGLLFPELDGKNESPEDDSALAIPTSAVLLQPSRDTGLHHLHPEKGSNADPLSPGLKELCRLETVCASFAANGSTLSHSERLPRPLRHTLSASSVLAEWLLSKS